MILSNIDIFKLRSTDYIFEATPDPQSDYLYLIILYGLFVILSFGLWFLYNKKQKEEKLWRKMRGRIFNFFFYTGIVGLILIFARFQQISYIGSRFFALLLWLTIIIWLIYILIYRYGKFSRELLEIKKKNNFTKYLPTKK